MRRINGRTVEFTNSGEVRAKERFDEALDDGLSIRAAATVALEEGIVFHWRFSRQFVEYLSEGTVIVTKGGRVAATPKGREFP